MLSQLTQVIVFNSFYIFIAESLVVLRYLHVPTFDANKTYLIFQSVALIKKKSLSMKTTVCPSIIWADLLIFTTTPIIS